MLHIAHDCTNKLYISFNEYAMHMTQSIITHTIIIQTSSFLTSLYLFGSMKI